MDRGAILANVNNLDLNIRRARKLWKEDDYTDRDMVQAKDEFSKTKFTYLELLSKNHFILSIVDSTATIPDSLELEENLAQSKATLKKSKGRCKTLKTELENMLVEICKKEQDLQSDATVFANDEMIQDTPQQNLEDDSVLRELKDRIEEKKATLEEQESRISELNKQKTELELSVKGLDSKLESNAPTDHSRILARRMMNWYQKANTVLKQICGVQAVDIQESEVRITYLFLNVSCTSGIFFMPSRNRY